MKVELILIVALIMWLFNKLAFVKPPVKDGINVAVIALLVFAVFYYKMLP